jgi:hypothetical protein
VVQGQKIEVCRPRNAAGTAGLSNLVNHLQTELNDAGLEGGSDLSAAGWIGGWWNR